MPEQQTSRRHTVRRVLIVVVVAVAAAVGFALLVNRHGYFDLGIYRSALIWWRDGNDLYDYVQADRVQGQLYFTYPPFAALLLLPVSFFTLPVAGALFTAGTVLAVLVTTRWLAAPTADACRVPRWYAAALAVPLVLLIEPLRENIAFGQINMLLVMLVLLDLLILGPRGSRWAGIGVGLATAIKLFPGIFIIYLLVSRQWRASITAMVTATGATLLAAVIAPRASWQFWTGALWDTDRVGRTDYTGNQSLQGLLSRLVAPEPPSTVWWLLLVALVLVFGMWRAAKAGVAGDPIAAIAITGLVGSLVSPLTWPHHLWWLVPALIALAGAACTATGGRRVALWSVTIAAYGVSVAGVVTLVDWGIGLEPTDTVGEFLARNAFVLLSLMLLFVVPIRPGSWNYSMSAP